MIPQCNILIITRDAKGRDCLPFGPESPAKTTFLVGTMGNTGELTDTHGNCEIKMTDLYKDHTYNTCNMLIHSILTTLYSSFFKSLRTRQGRNLPAILKTMVVAITHLKTIKETDNAKLLDLTLVK
jgi:hypothetical protein